VKRQYFLEQGLVTSQFILPGAIHRYQTFRPVKNIASKLPNRPMEQLLAVLALMACEESSRVSQSSVSGGLGSNPVLPKRSEQLSDGVDEQKNRRPSSTIRRCTAKLPKCRGIIGEK
jgi:hypothetical protein